MAPPPFKLEASRAGASEMSEDRESEFVPEMEADTSIQHADAPPPPDAPGDGGEGKPSGPLNQGGDAAGDDQDHPDTQNADLNGKLDTSPNGEDAPPAPENNTDTPPSPENQPSTENPSGNNPANQTNPANPSLDGGGGGGAGNPAAPVEQAPVSLDNSSAGSLVRSLGSQQPVAMVSAIKQVGADLPAALENERTAAQEMLPEIEQPTGLNATSTDQPQVNPLASKGQEPELKTPADGEKQEVPTDHVQSQGPNPAALTPTPPAQNMSSPAGLRHAAAKLPSSDGGVNTSAGPRPQIELTGDLNPVRNEQAQTTADGSVDQEKLRADQQIGQDFGENGMYPSLEKEQMSSAVDISSGGAGFNATMGELPQLDAQTTGALNSGIMTQYGDKFAAEMDKQAQGELEYQTQAKAEQEKGLGEIEAETVKVREQQLAEQQKGKSEIDSHRQAWEQENEGVRKEFASQSRSKRAEVDAQINTKVRETNAQVDREYANAEAKARQEEQKANQKAAAEKRKAEEKEKDKSWWESALDAVGDFFESLKQAVTAIFDALRDLVSAIIEKAKELAGQLIDWARDAIKGMIDAFAEVLKTFVRLALAAFPGIAEKFCNLIDQAVAITKQAIDALAEGLKAAVQFILDAVGSAINALLSVYEFLIQGILAAMEAYVILYLKVIRGIANLVAAAGDMPGFFFGQATEELMGTDVTAALKNEYPEAAVPAVQQAVPDTGEVNRVVDAGSQDSPGEMMSLLSKESYTEDDFQVPVLDNALLDPALMAQMGQMGEGEHSIAEFNDEGHGIESLKAEMGYDASAPVAETGAGTEPAQPAQGMAAPVASVPADAGRDRFKPDGQGMVGPFSVGERTKFVAGQMVDGIKSWFSENWGKILLALLGIITGAVLLNILTGGAIMAALPLVMQLVSAYFAAEAIVKMTGYFGKYLGQAFPGNIAGGAKSLARGLAVGAIELVFALMFGGKAAFKAVKSGAKTLAKGGVKGLAKSGVTLAKQGIKSTAKNAGKLGKVAWNGTKTAGRNMVKGGKFVMSGLKRGAITGAKTLDDLGKRLGKLTKFRGFRVVIKGRKWRLEGKMNPWVLLANGTILEVDDAVTAGKNNGDTVRVDTIENIGGQKIPRNQKAVVVNDSPKAMDDLPSMKQVQDARVKNPDFEVVEPSWGNRSRKIMSDADSLKNRIDNLELKRKSSRLSKVEQQELSQLTRQWDELAAGLDDLPSFKSAAPEGRLLPPGTKVDPQVVGELNHAQGIMNDLIHSTSSFGDKSTAWITIAEQLKGGKSAAAIVGGTLHHAKGLQYLDQLFSLAKHFDDLAKTSKVLESVSQRIIKEIRKIQEAAAWADDFAAKCGKGSKAPFDLNSLPAWAKSKPEFIQQLNDFYKHAPTS